jgi:hypothetical protein
MVSQAVCPGRQDATWQVRHNRLRGDQWAAAGPRRRPSAGMIDSRSSPRKQGARGDDAGKPVKNRKRPILVDPLGLRFSRIVTAARVQDRDGATSLLDVLRRRVARLRVIWADPAYAGARVAWVGLTALAHHPSGPRQTAGGHQGRFASCPNGGWSRGPSRGGPAPDVDPKLRRIERRPAP